MASVEIRNLTRRVTPRFAYASIAEAIIPGWEISLVFVGPTQARALNTELRGKEYVPNVLSYELGEKHGEIIICLAEAAKQAPAHGMDIRRFVLYLFIHGALHLKGLPHGGTMERWEKKILARFSPVHGAYASTHVTTHNDRHRHRDVPGQDGRRRGAR